MSEVLKISVDLSGKLDLINKRLAEVLKTDNERLNEMSSYTISSGGKRLRPLIILLVYELNTTKPVENVLDLSVAYEIMHSASLIHDDIIDESEERRGVPSLHKKYGLEDAIVTGDYLFSVAYRIGASYGTDVSIVVAKAAQKLAEGQIEESMNLGNFDITEDTYFNIITNKTAYFFGAGAKPPQWLQDPPSRIRIICSRLHSMWGWRFRLPMTYWILWARRRTPENPLLRI